MIYIYKFLLWLAGWKVSGEIPEGLNKCVFAGAPHTSNWDAFLGLAATSIWGIKFNFLIKQEALVFPVGGLLKAMGAIPIDRSRSEGTVEQAVEAFHKHEKFYLGVTPEGTRSYRPEWKKGFYHLAIKANVPIAMAYINYRDKVGGVGPIFYPTGDLDKDIEELMNFYRDKPGKYPENGVI